MPNVHKRIERPGLYRRKQTLPSSQKLLPPSSARVAKRLGQAVARGLELNYNPPDIR